MERSIYPEKLSFHILYKQSIAFTGGIQPLGDGLRKHTLHDMVSVLVHLDAVVVWSHTDGEVLRSFGLFVVGRSPEDLGDDDYQRS